MSGSAIKGGMHQYANSAVKTAAATMMVVLKVCAFMLVLAPRHGFGEGVADLGGFWQGFDVSEVAA